MEDEMADRKRMYRVLALIISLVMLFAGCEAGKDNNYSMTSPAAFGIIVMLVCIRDCKGEFYET